MKTLAGYLADLWRSDSGSALVEASLIMPVALLLMAGVVDFGMAFSTQATADKAVRDAARYLSKLPSSAYCPTSTVGSNWAIQHARNLAVYGNVNGNGNPLISNWSTSNVTAACELCSNTTNCNLSSSGPQYVVTVSATAPYTSIVVGRVFPIAGTYTLSTQHEERNIGN